MLPESFGWRRHFNKISLFPPSYCGENCVEHFESKCTLKFFFFFSQISQIKMIEHSTKQRQSRRESTFGSYPQAIAPQKKRKWYQYGIIYRVLYWCLVMLFLVLVVVALHFGLKVEFGQCSAYDIKCGKGKNPS